MQGPSVANKKLLHWNRHKISISSAYDSLKIMTEESSFIGEDLQVKENNEKLVEKTSKWKDAFIIETVNDNDN